MLPLISNILIQYGLMFGLLFSNLFNFTWSREKTISLLFLALLIVIIEAFKTPSKYFKLNLIDLLFVSFLCLILLSFFFQGIEKTWVIKNIKYIPFFVVLPYFVGKIFDIKNLSILIFGLFLCFIAALFLSGVYFYDHRDFFHYRPYFSGRDDVTSYLSNLIGLLFVLTTSKLCKTKKFIIYYFFALQMLSLILVFLGFRGAVLSAFISSILILWNIRRPALIFAIPIIFVCNFFIVKNIYPHSENATNEVIAITSTYNSNSENNSENICTKAKTSPEIRMVLLKQAWQSFSKNILAGNGAGSFGQVSCWTEDHAHPHNIIFQVLAELGLIGFLILASMIFYIYFSFNRNTKKSIHSLEVYSVFFYSLFLSFTAGDYFTSSDFWFSLGLLSALINNITSTKNNGLKN